MPIGNPSRNTPGSPEILPRRMAPKSRAWSDENLDLLAHLLDDWLRIPGTSIRFGLDAIIGLVPGLGDVMVGIASCILLLAAWIRGVPYVALIRMAVNIAIDVLVGSIPILGDAFDIAWKANRRNYALLVRHVHEPRQHTWKDWIFLLLIALVILAIFALPILVLIGLIVLLRDYGYL
ncbi:MAG TPA: DUF4112 domain-containing protein [Acidobacteriaceae bacterium]|jgi:hypothetical protein|nr:DUF4112 domain-containing protein [Acidobacteriaceae bacterium]